MVVVRSGPDAADAGFWSEQAAAGEHTARRLRAGHGVEHTRAAPAAQRSAWPAGLVRGKRSCCVARLFPFLPLTRLLRLWPTCVAMHPRRASVRRLRVCRHGSVMCPQDMVHSALQRVPRAATQSQHNTGKAPPLCRAGRGGRSARPQHSRWQRRTVPAARCLCAWHDLCTPKSRAGRGRGGAHKPLSLCASTKPQQLLPGEARPTWHGGGGWRGAAAVCAEQRGSPRHALCSKHSAPWHKTAAQQRGFGVVGVVRSSSEDRRCSVLSAAVLARFHCLRFPLNRSSAPSLFPCRQAALTWTQQRQKPDQQPPPRGTCLFDVNNTPQNSHPR